MKDEFLFFSFLFLFLEMAAKSELRGSVGGENKKNRPEAVHMIQAASGFDNAAMHLYRCQHRPVY